MESLEIILERGTRAFTEEEKRALAARKNDYYKELIQQITPQDILPGISTLLSHIRTHKIRCGLASASANAPTILRLLGIENLLDFVADPTKLKAGKPCPDIFIEAARGLGVKPECCVGVEDAHAGIKAIKSAGMFAVGIGTHLADAECDLLLKDTSELSLDALSAMLEGSSKPYGACA